MPSIKPGVVRAIKYGPWVVQAIKYGHEPVQKAAAAAMDNRANRKLALGHADTLKQGTVLTAFARGRRRWVVFAGDTPVAAYPFVEQPLAALVEHADLSKRQTPEQVRAQHRLGPAQRARKASRRQLPWRRG